MTGESYKAYVPEKLPPVPALMLDNLFTVIDTANQKIGMLSHIEQSIPNKSLFVYMYIRKEALLSSQIEGTQSSFFDFLFFENQQKPRVGNDDVEEVSNHVHAMNHALRRVDEGFPLCMRLLRETHSL